MASITFLARANTTSGSTPIRSCVVGSMALWTVAFLGGTPIGGRIVGLVGAYAGPRWALATAAASCFGAAALGASKASIAITRRLSARRDYRMSWARRAAATATRR